MMEAPETQLVNPSADPNFDWKYWLSAEDPPPSSMPPSIKEEGQASGWAPGTPPPSPDAGSQTSLPEHKGPPQSQDPKFPLGDQSLGADSQPVDPQALTYALKGKAKEARRISGTARDVGNAAQRELQPSERSLDRGE